MRLQVTAFNNGIAALDAALDGEVVLSEVFNGIGIKTTDDKTFGIAQRDTGLEIVCPDGAMVEVKLDAAGDTYVVSHRLKNIHDQENE